jgi:hypothetical protein
MDDRETRVAMVVILMRKKRTHGKPQDTTRLATASTMKRNSGMRSIRVNPL